MTTFEAQYSGVCTACDEWFEKGTAIRMSSAGAQHDRCPESDLPARREVCPRCFTEQSVSGTCSCEEGQ